MTEDEQKEIEKDEQSQDKKENRMAWLRLALFTILPLIPLVTGLTCLIGGTNSDNKTVAFAGALVLEVGLPAVMIILVVAGLIWKFHGVRKSEPDTTSVADNSMVADEARSDEAKEQAPSQREREQKAIDAVGGTHGFASRANMAEYEADHIAEGMRNAPKWGLPVGIGMFLLIVADVVGATVLAIKEIFVGTIVCAALFAGFVITALIVMSVSRTKATDGDIGKAKKITTGKVKTCFMVGTTTTKSGGMRHGNGGTVRINSVTYRVIVIADGIEYGAYSKRFYETDENVTVAVMGKKRAKIVEDVESEKIKSE